MRVTDLNNKTSNKDYVNSYIQSKYRTFTRFTETRTHIFIYLLEPIVFYSLSGINLLITSNRGFRMYDKTDFNKIIPLKRKKGSSLVLCEIAFCIR